MGHSDNHGEQKQHYIAQNMSHRFCIKVTKFHSCSFSCLRAVEEGVVGGGGGGGAVTALALRYK